MLSDLLTDHGSTDQIGEGYEHDRPAQAAAVPHLFGDLSGHIAGATDRTYANVAVTEASEKALLKFSRHALLLTVAISDGIIHHTSQLRLNSSDFTLSVQFTEINRAHTII